MVFGWVQANVKMAVFGRNGVAIRNSEEVLPCNEVMVTRVEQHPETVRTGAHAGVRNLLGNRLVLCPLGSKRVDRSIPTRCRGRQRYSSKTASLGQLRNTKRDSSFVFRGRQVANPPRNVIEVLPDVTKGLRSNGDISAIGIFDRPQFSNWGRTIQRDADGVRIAARLV